MNIRSLISGKRVISGSQAFLLLVITAVFWSSSGFLIKMIVWNPIAIAGARSAIAAVAIWPFIGKTRMKPSPPLVYGIIMYTATVIIFVASTKLTTAANAIILQYTAPIYIAIFGAWILKEKTGVLDWIIVVAVLGGMALFFLDDISKGNMLGNILAIIGGISYAFEIIAMRKLKGGCPLEIVFWGNILTAVIGLPFMTLSRPSPSSLLVLIVLGVFQLGIPFILYSIAIKNISALEAILVSAIEPILNPIWVLLFIGEFPSRWAFIGGTVVLLSISLHGIIAALKNSGSKEYIDSI